MYGLLFKAVSETILELTRDVKHLGANVGLICVLHTWGQNMKEHPHLHCIMPAGGLSVDQEHWVHVPDKNNFFIAGKVLAKKFRGKFLDMLKQAREKGKLDFYGKLSAIQGPVQFNRFLTPLYRKEEALEDGGRIWEKQNTVWNEILECIQNFRQPNCPACKKGKLRFAGLVKDDLWKPG